jgi:hypothetical protein
MVALERKAKEGGKVMQKKDGKKKAPKRSTGRLGSPKIKQRIKEAAKKYPLKKMGRKALEFLGASTPPKSVEGKTRAERRRAIKLRAMHEPRSAAISPEEFDLKRGRKIEQGGTLLARRAKGGQVGNKKSQGKRISNKETDGSKLVASLYD